MTTADEIELAAWRLAFDHIGDGTPNGAAKAINEEMDRLKRAIERYRKLAELQDTLAQRSLIDWSRLEQIGS